MAIYEVAETGEIQTLKNPLIIDAQHALDVARWAGDMLQQRRTIKGEARLDPRLEVSDLVTVESNFGVSHAVGITHVEITFNGAFKGSYEGRILKFTPVEAGYSGMLFSGEV